MGGESLRRFAKAEVALAGRSHGAGTSAVRELATTSGRAADESPFVAPAGELGVLLVTADRRLAAAFRDVAVTPDDIIEDQTARGITSRR